MKVTKLKYEELNLIIFGDMDHDYCGFAHFFDNSTDVNIGIIDDIALDEVKKSSDYYDILNREDICFDFKKRVLKNQELFQVFLGKQYAIVDFELKLITLQAFFTYHLQESSPSFIKFSDHFRQSSINNVISDFTQIYNQISFKSNISNKFYSISVNNKSESGFIVLDIIGENFRTRLDILPYKVYSLLDFARKDLNLIECWDSFLFHQIGAYLVLSQAINLGLSDSDIQMLEEFRCEDIPELFLKEKV